MSTNPLKNRKSVLFLLDERLPHERARVLTLTINALRTVFQVQTVSGGANEEVFLTQLAQKSYDIVLVPWYRYLAWHQVQAKILQSGAETSFCSYSAGSLFPYELGEFGGNSRFIHIDLCHLQQTEILQTLKLLAQNNSKSGLTPLLTNPRGYYFESWTKADSLGQKLDSISAIPDFKEEPWKSRLSAIQLSTQAVWNWMLMYKNTASTEWTASRFELAIHEKVLCLRFCFSARGLASKDGVRWFWPNSQVLGSPSEVLLKYCDFVRVHPLLDQEKIELTLCFFPSAPSIKASQEMHTLWVEPVHSSTITEPMVAEGAPAFNEFKKLPVVQGTTVQQSEAGVDFSAQIWTLKKAIMEKDEIIHDLRSGGVSLPPPLAPPETEELIDALGERFLELQLELGSLSQDPPKNDQIKRKLELLREKEALWKTKLLSVLKGMAVHKKAS